MTRYLLNGITLRVPFLGDISTLVTEGDWRGAGGGPSRPFMCTYREPDDEGVQYLVGWLTISRDPAKGLGAFFNYVMGLLACACAASALILTLAS